MNNRTAWVIAALIISSIIYLLTASTARACKCAGPLDTITIKEELDTYDAVFNGRVISIWDEGESVGFEVNSVWKGSSKSQVIVTTNNPECCACGYPFVVGQSYVVWASKIEGGSKLTTSICTRTKLVNHATDDISQLGQGNPPTEKISIIQPTIIDFAESAIHQMTPAFCLIAAAAISVLSFITVLVVKIRDVAKIKPRQN